MNATVATQHLLLDFIVQWWTPAFFVIFLAILAYALWPRNRDKFDYAAKLPLRED
jgi:cytochrome c oxidase cbb3-type subunit 4